MSRLLFWRPRLMRLHLVGQEASIEGVFLGYRAGHYRLANASMLETTERSHPLAGETWVPRDRVLYGQVIG